MAAKTQPSRATPTEIIENSGHTLHARVVMLLRQLDWTVAVSPYYSDNFTDKPREIDIIAEKFFDAHLHGRRTGDIVVRLFIECKYIADTIVIWFDSKDMNRAVDRIKVDTGWSDTRGFAGLHRHHYHSPDQVAKLFSTGKGREEGDVFARAINQGLNALIYYRHQPDVHPRQDTKRKLYRRLVYPVIAVDKFDMLHRTEMSDSRPATSIAEPFQIEVNYAYLNRERNGSNEHFLIDVVSIDALPEFLHRLEHADVQAMRDYLRREIDAQLY